MYHRMIRQMAGLGSVLMLAAAFGCSSQSTTETANADRQPTAEGEKYLVDVSPGEVQDVIPMRDAVKDNEEVVVVGRIGGSQDPWVDGMAAFSIVDRSLFACTDIPGDKCQTPWDYCCATDRLPGATTLVKVVDEQGNVIPDGARNMFGLSELQTVVVKGTAQRDESGNVTILAKSIYVDPKNPGRVSRGDDDAPAHDHDHDHEHGHDHDDDHEDGAKAAPAPEASSSEDKGDS